MTNGASPAVVQGKWKLRKRKYKKENRIIGLGYSWSLSFTLGSWKRLLVSFLLETYFSWFWNSLAPLLPTLILLILYQFLIATWPLHIGTTSRADVLFSSVVLLMISTNLQALNTISGLRISAFMSRRTILLKSTLLHTAAYLTSPPPCGFYAVSTQLKEYYASQNICCVSQNSFTCVTLGYNFL